MQPSSKFGFPLCPKSQDLFQYAQACQAIEMRESLFAGHPEFTVDFQHALNEYRVKNGSMTIEEKKLAEQDMLSHPVSEQNARELALVLQDFLKMTL